MKYIILVLTAAFTFDSIVMPSDYENGVLKTLVWHTAVISASIVTGMIIKQSIDKPEKDILKRLIKAQYNDIENVTKKYENISRTVNTLEKEKQDLLFKLKTDQDEVLDLRIDLERAHKKNSELTNQANAAQLETAEISDLRKTLDATKEELDSAIAIINLLRQELEDAKKLTQSTPASPEQQQQQP